MKDLKLTFCDDKDLAQVAGTYYSDVLDLDAAALNLGTGAPIFTKMVVTTAFAGTGATLVATLEQAIDEAFTSPEAIRATGTLALTALTLSDVIMNTPFDGDFVSMRFMRIKFVIAVATTTAGTVTAYMEEIPV